MKLGQRFLFSLRRCRSCWANNSLRSVLEGCQRFDIVNLLRVPFSALVFIIPAAALRLGLRLPGIVLLLVASRLVSLLAHWLYCLQVLPCLRSWPTFSDSVVRPLIKFGGWVTVGNIVNPILLSMERFFIGSLLSVSMWGITQLHLKGNQALDDPGQPYDYHLPGL